MKLPDILHTISDELSQKGASAVLVGGCVRDYFLKIPVKDYDIEVFGLKKIEDLERILSKYGEVRLVGKSFGVIKFIRQKEEYDFSFPRKERKIDKGHRGFDIRTYSGMSFEEAAGRRDFTVNALGYEISTGSFLDPFGGREDLRNGILRYIDDNTFIEDPLRVYRGVQFCARFGFVMDDKTKSLCKKMVESGVLSELPRERVFVEIKKMLLKSKKPSKGFDLLRDLGMLSYLKPLDGLAPSLWNKMLKRVDFAADFKVSDEKKDLVLMFCALCMDMKLSECEYFIKNLTLELSFRTQVLKYLSLSEEIPRLFENKGEDIDAKIRKLSTKVRIVEFVRICRVRFFSNTKKRFFCERLLEESVRLGVSEKAPEPLVFGRDLLDMGYEASPKFKEILEKVYQKQLEGAIATKEEAINFIKKEDDL